MKILALIPARFGSTRFPGKALAEIGDKTMVQRVYEQAKKCKAFSRVVVATDHEKILKAVEAFGGEAIMTSTAHQSGTDRCMEAYNEIEERYEYVVNVQGDEPFINPKQLLQLCQLLHGNRKIATLIKKIDSVKTLFDSNIVKVIQDKNGNAIYFSRATLPFQRGVEKDQWLSNHSYYRHIGLYAYRTDVLKEITQLAVSNLEKSESLEQLRWIENGYSIAVAETEFESIGIDTPEDLEKVKKFYS